jgi:hypothetical protein
VLSCVLRATSYDFHTKFNCLCVCMYVRMHACMYVCMSVCMHICMYVYVYVCTRVCVCMHACMFVCMYACMYVCMSVCIYVCIYACVYSDFIWNGSVVSGLCYNTLSLITLKHYRLFEGYQCVQRLLPYLLGEQVVFLRESVPVKVS